MNAADIVAAIDAAYASAPREKVRTYIGASAIGNSCDAALAYGLRGFPDDPPPPRLKRIFDLGHLVEDVVVRDLKRAGLAIIERDPMTNKQWTYEDFEGYAICHTDGLWEKPSTEVTILEVKSMNKSKFEHFKSGGVAYSHPGYYAQMQMMMGMSKIPEALFIAYCKDNSEYWAELVPFNQFYWESQRYRIERIMTDRDIHKINDDIFSFSCSGCFKRSACYGIVDPKVECRTCAHSVAGTNAGWFCTLLDRDCDQPCHHYKKYEAKPPR